MTYNTDITDLANATAVGNGTGVFDKLMQSVEIRLDAQYKAGRLEGTKFADVYLGSMQSVLSESIRFILQEKTTAEQAALLAEQVKSEQKNNESGGIIDQQKRKVQEEIDLVIAQTASQYESVKASAADTARKNLLNSKNVTLTEKQTNLVVTQEAELELNGVEERKLIIEKTIATTSGGVDNTNKTNADIDLSGAQKLKVDADKILTDSQNAEVADNAASQRAVNTAQVSKIGSEITLLGSRNLETLAGTTRTDTESAQRVLLMEAQTTGFGVNAKQNLLKQLYEGYAVNTTTEGAVQVAPTGSTATALDLVANDILDDLQSSVNI